MAWDSGLRSFNLFIGKKSCLEQRLVFPVPIYSALPCRGTNTEALLAGLVGGRLLERCHRVGCYTTRLSNRLLFLRLCIELWNMYVHVRLCYVCMYVSVYVYVTMYVYICS